GGRQGRQGRCRLRGRGAEALGADRRRLDQEGQRQGHRWGQGARGVPRGAEEGRRRSVSQPAASWKGYAEGILGVAASAILLSMMLLTVVDVVARYGLDRRVRCAVEVTERLLT